MTHSITSTETSPLKLLQAQQAFKKDRTTASSHANGSGSVDSFKAPVDEAILSNGKTIKHNSALKKSPALSAYSAAKFNEINTIAQQVGYVGLTESDIQRALISGESLLTDHHA